MPALASTFVAWQRSELGSLSTISVAPPRGPVPLIVAKPDTLARLPADTETARGVRGGCAADLGDRCAGPVLLSSDTGNDASTNAYAYPRGHTTTRYDADQHRPGATPSSPWP